MMMMMMMMMMESNNWKYCGAEEEDAIL